MTYQQDGGRKDIGWTVRDEYLARAMQAIVSTNAYSVNDIVQFSSMVADAIIKERTK